MYFANSSCFDSLRKQLTFRNTTAGFPEKWCLRNKHRTSILITYHYPDLGSASDWLKQISHMEIRSTMLIRVVIEKSFCRGNQSWHRKMLAVYSGYFFYIFIYHIVYSDELLEQLEDEKQARKNAEEKINELKGGLQHF